MFVLKIRFSSADSIACIRSTFLRSFELWRRHGIISRGLFVFVFHSSLFGSVLSPQCLNYFWTCSTSFPNFQIGVEQQWVDEVNETWTIWTSRLPTAVIFGSAIRMHTKHHISHVWSMINWQRKLYFFPLQMNVGVSHAHLCFMSFEWLLFWADLEWHALGYRSFNSRSQPTSREKCADTCTQTADTEKRTSKKKETQIGHPLILIRYWIKRVEIQMHEQFEQARWHCARCAISLFVAVAAAVATKLCAKIKCR